MDVVVTDVTEMRDGHVCVAGWAPDEDRMVRPLQNAEHPHWLADENLFKTGNVINVTPLISPQIRGLPHNTEDCIVGPNPVLKGRVNDVELVERVSGSVHRSAQELFGDAFVNNKYVLENEGVRSLGAIEITAQPLRFYDSNNKLTCWFIDNDENRYSLPLKCCALVAIYTENGLDGLNALMSRSGKIHVRLGLAGGWEGQNNEWQPRRCFAMVNGLYFV